MRKHLLAICLTALCATGAMAQDYDLTKLYLQNAGFDSRFDYTIDDTVLSAATACLDAEASVRTAEIALAYTQILAENCCFQRQVHF